jgi:hypothetical protein
MHTATSFLILGTLLCGFCAGCCKSRPASKDDLRTAAEFCVDICPGDPKGSTADKAMNKGCKEGCIEECEKKFPGTCKSLVK